MKLCHLFFIIFICAITLIGCANTMPPGVNQNLLEEDWMHTINLNPMLWTHDADRWFFTGEPNQTESDARRASNDKAVSMMAVKVPQFTNVTINGCFQVQIVGHQAENSVFILGPNEEVRQIVVHVSGDTLVVGQPRDEKNHSVNLKNVIVRIGVSNLRHLQVIGGARVEGRALTSNGMVIDSNNSGTVLLAGDINLLKIDNAGSGAVSVIGAYTPCLSVIDTGSGSVNVSGRIGIQSIDNLGSGQVNIIGADSRSLVIRSCGSSQTAVAGYANLKRLDATDHSCVHFYWVNSQCAQVALSGNARVGLAGIVKKLDLSLSGQARFGGQYLHANTIYVQARNNAHANISGSKKIFASAVDNSNIYFFGPPSLVSRYTAGHGSIIPVWSDSTELPVPSYAPQFITSVNKRPG